MNNRTAFKAFAAILPLLAIACEKEIDPGTGGENDRIITEYESSDIPETVPYNGGTYHLALSTETVTRSAGPEFVEWRYRLTEGTSVQEPVTVSEATEEVTVEISPNYSENERDIMVEISYGDNPDEWETVVRSRQEAAMTQVGGFWWAKANVTVKDNRFVLADRMSDAGYFFRNGSIYGVPSGPGDTYAGTAYNPKPVQTALTEIPYGNPEDDPCTMVDPGFRTPTYEELYSLYNAEYLGQSHSLDGVNGMGYMNSDFFMPFSGAMDVTTGTIGFRSTHGGYWGLGENSFSENIIYTMSGGADPESQYSLVYYDLVGTNMASLRCVKNITQPSYLSHTPATVDNCSEFTLSVKTSPGEFGHYEVEIEADDGSVVMADATSDQPDVNITVPANTYTEPLTWKLFVNRRYTGVTFEQPGLKDYVILESVTPSSAGYEAFSLTITYSSDMASFPAAIKGDDGLSLEQTCTGSAGKAVFEIPENTGKERKLSVWINGQDTGESVTQEGKPVTSAFSVTWSEGYLTVKDGQYAFAAPDELGMFFKWKSGYGIDLGQAPTSGSGFEGTAYGPEATEFGSYAEIPAGEADPCAQVAPAGTWRMPSVSILEELTAETAIVGEDGGCKTVSDGEQTVRFAPSGQLKTGGNGVSLPLKTILVWSSEETADDPAKGQYLMWSATSSTSTPRIAKASKEAGHMIRCVRDK